VFFAVLPASLGLSRLISAQNLGLKPGQELGKANQHS